VCSRAPGQLSWTDGFELSGGDLYISRRIGGILIGLRPCERYGRAASVV
jgi:hypothetical protein